VVHLGTSGYAYPHWRGLLYPKGLPQKRWFSRYQEVFSCVELNATFYRLPSPATVRSWRDGARPGFLFAAKGSRYLTHMKRLKDAGVGLQRFFDLLLPLAPKLRVVLWQLPPQMNRLDLPRLIGFIDKLPREVRHAFEFRSDAWYTGEVCDVLDAYGAAFCEHDLVRARPPRITGGFRYVRFHGAGAKYGGRYGRAALRPWARSLRAFRGDSWVFFNNDLGGNALYDALELNELLGEATSAAARSTASLELPVRADGAAVK
jgi:uncharacterized protein YecE (DUF72 family)